MAKIKVGINGFGRIGRITLRRLLTNPDIEVVAINDLTDSKTLAHLFKYDSVHGRFDGTVSHTEDSLIINGKTIHATKIANIDDLKWGEHGIDIVVESTGLKKYLEEETAMKHITSAGAKKVVLSAPASKGNVKTIVMGVNDSDLLSSDVLISNASCTTNCLAPMTKILDDNFGVEQGMMSTVHAYTSDQRLHDAPHSDLRRARAAAQSIVPSSTGASKAVGKVLKHLNGKLDGSSYRVPVLDGSIVDFTVILKNEASVEQINAAFKKAADNELKGVLEYSDEPLVSVDILSNPHSCIFDSDLTQVMGKMVKVCGWYDNEYGYSSRMADLVVKLMNA